jgi:hypothetical protein
MLNQSGPTSDPQGLLSSTRDLTHRVRLTQRGAWFPLLIFAAVTFAAIPFNRYGRHAIRCSATHGGGKVCIAYSVLALWYWPVALLAAYVAISWFYLRRSQHRGVGSRVWPFVAVGAFLTLLVTVWAFWADAHPAFLAYTLRLQSGQTNQVLYRIASPAGAIGIALLLLAWIERSRPLLIVSVAYLIVAVSTVGIGWFAHPTPWAPLPHLLIDGGVLLIGGILLAATQAAPGPSNP